METIGKLLAEFVPPEGISNLTDPDEPYILTADEEALIIANKIEAEKKLMAWKMAQAGAQEGTILLRIAQTDWNERIGRDKVLQQANAAKNQALWHKEQEKRRGEEQEREQRELVAYWTASRMYGRLRNNARDRYGKELIENADTMPLIKALCFFLSRDPRFETELGYSLKKGLLIRGVSGLGKTFLVECLADNGLNPVRILSLIEITDAVKQDGEYQVSLAGANTLYLDDVATESTPVKYYGTELHWFKDYLELYYSRKRPFNQLMISTNCSFQQLEDKYGFRVRSRIKDMFNIIDVTGKDLRG
jgi:DNA replication protein DnaC